MLAFGVTETLDGLEQRAVLGRLRLAQPISPGQDDRAIADLGGQGRVLAAQIRRFAVQDVQGSFHHIRAGP